MGTKLALSPTKATDMYCIESDTVLEALAKQLIFRVEKNEEGLFDITELCDNYRELQLTKEQLLQLADEIKALANST